MPKRVIKQHGITKENAKEISEMGREAYREFLKDPVRLAQRKAKTLITRKINQEIEKYREKVEKRVAKLDKIYERIEKELEAIPIGTMPAAFLDIALRYAKQLHEAQLGKPRQHTEVKTDLPITLVIQEEPEPMEIEYREVEEASNVLIEEIEDATGTSPKE